MKYQLMKPVNENYTALEQILTNRDVLHGHIKRYMNTDETDICAPEDLGEEALWNAMVALAHCVSLNEKAMVIVDCDCDGYTASALLINYLYDLFPAWVENNVDWFMHEGKQHGLSDFPMERAKNYRLFLIPDASSEDYEYHKQLKEMGKDIVILDHHEAEYISPDAIVINNQLSDYPNKDMSGVGIVWQFCRYIDKHMNKNFADNYLDLVALGLDGDMMSLLAFETKHLIKKGFEQVQNPFFAAMADKNSYSMKNKITPMGVAFYVVPMINAVVRSGTLEEKELIFQSMLKFRAFERIPSNKRGHKPGEMEQLYIQAVRIATNVKNRQTRAQEAGMTKLEAMIEDQQLLDNKVLMFLLNPGDIDRNIAGLVANKIMSKYQRPCCILTRVEEISGGEKIIEDGPNIIKFTPAEIKVSYQGSARGCDITGITRFKEMCENTETIMYAKGHQGAFGLGIYSHTIGFDDEVAGENILQFIEKTNKMLEDTPDEAIYYVDYIYKGVDVSRENILDIAELDYLWGKDMPESLVAVENLKITKDMITLMSPDKKPTLKITLPNKVSIVKFNSSQEEYDSLYSEHGAVEINLVGTCNKNEWNGYITPQILVQDYEIVDKMQYVF